MFSKIPWRTGIDTGRLSCELHGEGVKSVWSKIRELEPASGAGTLGSSVEPVARDISAGFLSDSSVGAIVNSGPVWSILVVER